MYIELNNGITKIHDNVIKPMEFTLYQARLGCLYGAR